MGAERNWGKGHPQSSLAAQFIGARPLNTGGAVLRQTEDAQGGLTPGKDTSSVYQSS